jgi:hypothetical protein
MSRRKESGAGAGGGGGGGGGAPSSSSSARGPVVEVIPKAPPNFELVPAEAATKYTYNLKTRKWHSVSVQIKLDTTPFSKGALRLVYHMAVCTHARAQAAAFLVQYTVA